MVVLGEGLLHPFPGAFLGFSRELGFHRQMELLSLFSLPSDRPTKPVITGDQHPLFWSWDGYINTKSKQCFPRLYFEDPKFPFGGHGIQLKQGTWLRGGAQLSARRARCRLEGSTRQDGPQSYSEGACICTPRTPPSGFLPFLI